MRAALVLILVASGFPMLATADLVVPVDSVKQFVNIRAEPNAESDIIGRLYQGDNQPLIESADGWHKVEIETDFNGYTSADWTKVVSEAVPAESNEEEVAEEVADTPEPIAETSAEDIVEDVAPVELVEAVIEEATEEVEARQADRG